MSAVTLTGGAGRLTPRRRFGLRHAFVLAKRDLVKMTRTPSSSST